MRNRLSTWLTNDEARAACLAMLEAWPGMVHMEAHRVNNPAIILPLTEASDE
jgi:hypothetical protein